MFEKIVNYSYKRENHFNEWLSQFQAQEMTNIPPEVIDQLRAEFKKMKIKKLDEITHTNVRQLLKKLKWNKYYEHVPYITNILNGIKPPNMPQELEERLRIMFKDIQKPFDDNCPKDRKNFLSYSYVLYKFCELLSEDTYLKILPTPQIKRKVIPTRCHVEENMYRPPMGIHTNNLKKTCEVAHTLVNISFSVR